MSVYEINVAEPYFSMLGDQKVVEGRLYKGKFAKMNVGDVLHVQNSAMVKVLSITKVERFVSFEQMLMDAHNLSITLPGTATVDQGVDIYRQFYSAEDEALWGVVALTVTFMN